MYRKSKSQEKENCRLSANINQDWAQIRKLGSLTSRKQKLWNDNEVEMTHEEEPSYKVEPVVDEVHKSVVHIQKKDRKHIGEEAFVPITL